MTEESDLFTGATEDEWVARLQAKHGAACAGVFEHQGMDAGLGDARLAATLADGDDEGGGVGEGEDFAGDEFVVEDDVAVLEEMQGAEGEEGGRAGAGSAEVDVSVDGAGMRPPRIPHLRSEMWGTRIRGCPHITGVHCGSLGLVRAWARA